MQHAVANIEPAEGQRFDPSPPLGEYNRRAVFLVKPLDQFRDVCRVIFSVRIHENDGIARHVLFDVRKSYGDRALVSKVTAEAQDVDGRQCQKRNCTQV